MFRSLILHMTLHPRMSPQARGFWHLATAIIHHVPSLCAWSIQGWAARVVLSLFMPGIGSLLGQIMDFLAIFLRNKLFTKLLSWIILLTTCPRSAQPFMDAIFLHLPGPTWHAV